jgi:hypothetical protein
METTPSPDKWAHLEPKAAAIMRDYSRAYENSQRLVREMGTLDEQMKSFSDEAEAKACGPVYDPEAVREAFLQVGYAASAWLEARRLYRIAKEDFERAQAKREGLGK